MFDADFCGRSILLGISGFRNSQPWQCDTWNDVGAESTISHAVIVFISNDRGYFSAFSRSRHFNRATRSLFCMELFLDYSRGRRREAARALRRFASPSPKSRVQTFDAANEPSAFRKFYERCLCLDTLNDSPGNKSPNFLCACERASQPPCWCVSEPC